MLRSIDLTVVFLSTFTLDISTLSRTVTVGLPVDRGCISVWGVPWHMQTHTPVSRYLSGCSSHLCRFRLHPCCTNSGSSFWLRLSFGAVRFRSQQPTIRIFVVRRISRRRCSVRDARPVMSSPTSRCVSAVRPSVARLHRSGFVSHWIATAFISISKSNNRVQSC